MRLLYTLFTLAVGGYGLFWVADKNPELKQKAEELIDFRKTTALETRFDSAQVMDIHQHKLLKERGMRFLTPEVKYYPHLLMEVKFCDKNNKTKEGFILWDLTDGEMVLDTKSWNKTHGYADCILNNTQSHEFKILKIIAENGGTCEATTLISALHLDPPILDAMLRSCMKKNLIILSEANQYRLHLANPKLNVIPETKLHDPLTTRNHKHADRATRHFSKTQIERIAKLAFGESFSIRTTTEVYLPIHRIAIQNSDGSVNISHFNALTGKELPPASFYQ